MAEFLDSHHTVSELSDLLKSSQQFLVIISPYLKIPNNFKKILKSLNFQKIDGRIIYDAKKPPKQEEIDFLLGIKGLKLFKCENLHAKCFINEKMGIITSMNLYEYSQTNNWEMGISFNRKTDGEIFSSVLDDINFMSENFQSENPGLLKKISSYVSEKSVEAYCIRCGEVIEYNPNHPLCNKHYLEWAKFKNVYYPEKYCHGCGEPMKTSSYSRPLCYDCFQAQKNKI